MAEETTPFATEATSDATLLNGENGETVQPEAAQAQTPPPTNYLSREDFEKWQTETDAKWQAQLEKVKRETQAKADKARDTAIRKAKEFDGYVETMKQAGVELDPEQIAAIKTKTIEREFWQPQPEPETPVPSLPDTVGADEIRASLAANGIVDEEIVSKYAGKPRMDGTAWATWDEDVTLAKAAVIQKKQAAKQQQQQAAQAAQVKATVGRVNPTPGGGAPALGYDPEKEIEKMMAEGTPDGPAERAKYIARLDKLQKEAGWT